MSNSHSTNPDAAAAASSPTNKTEGGGFFSKFINTIRKEINDLSYIEVVTAAGDPKTDINPDAEMVIVGLKAQEVKILARTRIELDGDIMVLLPAEKGSDEVKINKEILAIHKENVDTAVQNWNNFMKNILTALDLLMSVTGLSKSQALASFSAPLSSPDTSTSASTQPTPSSSTTSSTPTPSKPT